MEFPTVTFSALKPNNPRMILALLIFREDKYS